MSINSDYQYCETIIKENSASFYKAFKILPAEKRKAIYAIYAFCRVADDCVDEQKDALALDVLKNQLYEFKQGKTPSTPIFRALRDVFNHFDMSTDPFFELLQGQHKDLYFVQPSNLEDLMRYCYLVAGTVGLMILPVLATKSHKKLTQSAIQLGISMQITNILRDVGEDLKRNRVYIPKDLLLKHGVSLESLKSPTPDFIEVWEHLANTSEKGYSDFFKQVSLYDKDAQIAIKQSALFYRAILNAVRSNQYDCLNKRAHVSTPKKILLAFKSRR